MSKNVGAVMLTRELVTSDFHRPGTRNIKARKDHKLVVMYLGEVSQESLPHFRPDGVLAAFGFHQIPTAQLPDAILEDADRFRFLMRAMTPGSPESLAVDQVAEEEPAPDDEAPGEVWVAYTTKCTDLARSKVGRRQLSAEVELVEVPDEPAEQQV